MAETTNEDLGKKKFVELDSQTLPRLADALHNSGKGGNNYQFANVKFSDIAGGKVGAYPNAKSAAEYFTSIGLGDYTPGQVNQNLNNAEFISQFAPLGKSYSYLDLARESLQGDPNFDPGDEDAVLSSARDIQKRGFTNQDREKISTLSTTQSVQRQIDKQINPGKYLSEDQKAANTATAQRLAQQYGQDDPDTVDFIGKLLASGDSPFEVSQFLQTTPQFQERKAAQESERVKTESAAAREALNQELLKSQQEVFARAQPSIISSYMKAGRLNSSGLQNALAQAQTDLERERQGFLANAGYNDAIRAQGYQREDFVKNNAQAFNQYLRQSEPGYQQRFNVQDAANFANFQQPYNQLARQYQLSDETRQRQYQMEDYNRQQSDFNRYLDQYKKQGRDNALYGLAGTVLGAGARAGFGALF